MLAAKQGHVDVVKTMCRVGAPWWTLSHSNLSVGDFTTDGSQQDAFEILLIIGTSSVNKMPLRFCLILDSKWVLWIQLYRLWYDHPSKAVDWFIKKAKAAIDELAELPTWNPTSTTTTTNTGVVTNSTSNLNFEQHQNDCIIDNQMSNVQNSSFLPPPLNSNSIVDTIKSGFFFRWVAP
ncbi:unnamed protein product [Lactuca virosa]|uniref:TCP domain-containing protein n=1 Tax=Lactuca virosa TaxID=75947 RepID=A0AAU9M8J5_9ASTR|nr:unnamed protein product [Lactuca virosa]